MLKKKIAIVGSGISGLTSFYILSQNHDVSLFEANDYLGGHTHTVTVGDCNIDTGFIVFNQKTYPNFCQLLQTLNVAIQPSEMSFSYRSDHLNFEYNGHNLNTLFSDRRHLLNFNMYRFIKDIILFNHDAKKFLAHPHVKHMTVGEFIHEKKYTKTFVDCYLVPMMAAIWSKHKEDTLRCDAAFVFQFYQNHGFLDLFNRPKWYVIQGGSNKYIAPMIAQQKEQIYLNSPVSSIKREQGKIKLVIKNHEHWFDMVVIATHSDQALAMLEQPTPDERRILSAIPYTHNEVVLHQDKRIMPRNQRAWASWNYLDSNRTTPTLTYYMNRLQSLTTNEDFFVSLNLNESIDPKKIIRSFQYAHPCLTANAFQAQQQISLINGVNQTYYVGSYWGYGFHEDGVNSAIKTCRLIEH